MLTNDQMTVAMGAVRDQILAVHRDHEDKAHHGEACWGNRASPVAYVAHCLGVSNQNLWHEVLRLAAQYDRDCQDRSCPHG